MSFGDGTYHTTECAAQNDGYVSMYICTDATTAADKVTCFSQTGPLLTSFAPGALIAGITEGGTSQATPHVAGAVAVLASVAPQATPDDIQSAIANTGPVITDGRGAGTANRRRLDLLAAAQSVISSTALGGGRALRADFNGDGLSDMGVVYDDGAENATDTASLWVFLSTGSKKQGFVAEPWWHGPMTATAGKYVAGDFDGDGYADVAALFDLGQNTSGLWVFRSLGSKAAGGFSVDRWWLSGNGGFSWARSKVNAGDFDGDGRSDVAVAYDYGSNATGLWVFRSLGSKAAGGFVPELWWKSGAGSFSWARATPFGGRLDKGSGTSDAGVLYDDGNADADADAWAFLSSGAGAFTTQKWWDSKVGGMFAPRAVLT